MSELPGSVLIVGCGLIGTSIALGLRARGVRVQLEDVNPSNLATAVELGAGTVEPNQEPELVVVAVPPSSAAALAVKALATHPRSIVTDVSSVKASIVAAVTDDRFVGGHPMAGRESSGPAAAIGHLFEGRPWVLTPGPRTSVAATELVTAVVTGLGALPITMCAADHDQSVALVSHVPQLMSSLTAGLLLDAPPSATELAGPGVRDVTRIARSDAGLWVDIIDHNAANILPLLSRARDELDLLIKDLAGHVPSLLEQGRNGTKRIPGKHGALPVEVERVYVPIDDAPGELARLVTDVGESGVNLEDLRIDHEIGRPVGLVEIVVAPGRADELTAALSARGWAAYR